MTSGSDPQVVSTLKVFSRLAAALSFSVGCLVLTGWCFNIAILKGFIPSWIVVSPLSAVCFVLVGIALWLFNIPQLSHFQRRLAYACGGMVTALGLLILSEYLLRWTSGIDQLLFRATLSNGPATTGRMPLISAVNFSLLGISLLFVDARGRKSDAIRQLAALGAFLGALLGFLDIIVGPSTSYTGISLYSALTSTACSFGLFFLRPESGLMAYFTSNTQGGSVARRLVPAAICLPVIVQWMTWRIGELHPIDEWLAVALAVVLTITMLAILIGSTVHFLDKSDEMRRQAEDALQLAHDELEGRVEERTLEIQAINESLRVEVMERKMALEALRETAEAFRATQQMLQLVMNHIPQAIFWKDRQSMYLGCNDRLALDAGYSSPEEIVGKSDFDMPWAEQAPAYQADDDAVMNSDTPKLNYEEPSRQSDGNLAWLRTNKVALHDEEGTVVGILATYEDITQQKEAEAAIRQAREEAETANRAKSEFLSRMSHELRTPLNAILGFGQILEMGKRLNAKDSEAVSHILKSGRHLLGLINEVLDITRIETGHLALSPEPVCVAQTIREVLSIVSPLAAARHITVVNQAHGHDELFALTDQQRFRQVLLNLLSNAIKYNCDAGQVTVALVQEGQCLRIDVIDTGRGLSAEELRKLFVPFERLDAAKSDVEGTGIGLVLCKNLVEAMGGRIGVDSAPGRGSRFWVQLPLADNPLSALQQREEINSPPADSAVDAAPQKYRILYIEDNLSNLKVIENVLRERPDIQLISAMQGGIGIELARRHIPDLILLDLHLPDISGEVVLRRLKADPATSPIPVIMLSADAMPAHVAKMRGAGIEHYLTKPLDLPEFLRVVDGSLSEKAK